MESEYESIISICERLGDDDFILRCLKLDDYTALARHIYKVVGSQEIIAVLDALKANTYLRSLQLNKPVDNSVMVVLANMLQQNQTLHDLSLFGIQVDDEQAIALARGLQQNRGLESLFLMDNEIGPQGMAVLGPAIAQHPTLRYFCLSNNRLGDKEAVVLAVAIENHPTLVGLEVDENGMSDSGAGALRDALKRNKMITKLSLSEHFNPKILADVKKYLDHNRKSVAKKADKLFKSGLALYNKKRYQQATPLLEQAYRKYKQVPSFHKKVDEIAKLLGADYFRRGRAFYDKKQYSQAIPLLIQASSKYHSFLGGATTGKAADKLLEDIKMTLEKKTAPRKQASKSLPKPKSKLHPNKAPRTFTQGARAETNSSQKASTQISLGGARGSGSRPGSRGAQNQSTKPLPQPQRKSPLARSPQNNTNYVTQPTLPNHTLSTLPSPFAEPLQRAGSEASPSPQHYQLHPA